MKFSLLRSALIIITSSMLASVDADALPIREYRKFDREKQAVYVTAAVSMAANMYAAKGEIARAACIMDWFFRGKDGREPTGPHDLALEIGVAERNGPDKYEVEGVILGSVEKVCSSRSAKP